MSIGDNIKKLREAHGLNQLELGRIAGVSDKAVSTWENDIKTPRMGAIQKMSDYFGVQKSDIIDGDPQQFNSRDEKDIASRLFIVLNQLEEQEALMFDGEALDEETKELLIKSLEHSIRVGKAMAKQKFTPKKYRK